MTGPSELRTVVRGQRSDPATGTRRRGERANVPALTVHSGDRRGADEQRRYPPPAGVPDNLSRGAALGAISVMPPSEAQGCPLHHAGSPAVRRC